MKSRFAATVFLVAITVAPHVPAQIVAEISSDTDASWIDASFWESLDGKPATENWEFSDGEMRIVKPRGGNGSILTPPLPPNFELSWQWKAGEGTNTGLKYRVRKFGKHMFGNRYLGIEYQITDEKLGSTDKGSTASIYDLVGPIAGKPLNPTGQWNQSRIVAIGDQLEHYLNGTLVTTTTTSGPAWESMIAVSKFYGAADFGLPREGDRIMLTDHGGKAAYKDFHFTAHEAPPASETQRTGPHQTAPYLGNAMRNSWADQESIVLWTRTTASPDLFADGKRFISIDKSSAAKLSKETDPQKLMAAQIPEGTALSAMFGACPGAPGRVRLTYFPVKQRKAIKSTPWVTTSADSDFTAQWKIKELKPDTFYAAVIEAKPIDREELTAVVRGQFRTAPEKNAEEKLKFCVTTCHDFIRRDDGSNGHKIYSAMTQIEPDFVVHAGDIEYYDKPDPWAMTKELMRFKWGRIFALPSNRAFYASTTSYFLKDDHDTLKNDCWPGTTYGSVSFEQGVQIFNEEQFPSHSPRYQTVNWGRDLQVWFLEGRDFRSPHDIPDGPDKTILGVEQKAWLFQTLKESKAKFKLVFSPTPIVGPDRKGKKDNHANGIFAHEGNELREQLSKHDNLIVLCGDRHWQYASVDQQTNLWEFGCGPGSEKHQLGWKAGDERPMHRFLRVAGGFLSGDLTYRGKDKQPKLTLRHHKVTGEQVSEFVFPAKTPPRD